jgi:hypothetical protein
LSPFNLLSHPNVLWNSSAHLRAPEDIAMWYDGVFS